ncbi:MAG: HIT family protein [Gammaproteobacteria bacterium]|jgi:histidine triad (HIT) family protein|nr:HIT family protein [Gammaproteobacteria bacterium]
MRTDSNCIFCKIVAGDIPCFKLYEDELTMAFMDINPGNEGHALVIPKEHWEDVYAIPSDLIGSTTQTVKKIATAVEETLNPAGINLVQANGKGAAQSVFHFHMHILPRRMDDELKLNWGLRAGDMDAVKEVCERIKKNL